MEKRLRRPAGLAALFWRYLVTTAAAVALLAILWWGALTALMRLGAVYPANTAANQAGAVVRALTSGALDTADIPYYYRWAVFDGESVDPGNMDERHLAYARDALAGELVHPSPFYAQYHVLADLPGGGTCVLQYDFSMPYGAEALQRRLPEFQTCATAALLLSWLIAGAICTRHFAGILRRDAALLTAATETIALRRLDTPLTGTARVRELGETLAAMEQLRGSLAQSLESQWDMERQRDLELAALTHDLKTPLTVISGNAELLAEDALTPSQRESVDTILRGALRLQDYVAQLRAMAGREAVRDREAVELSELAADWESVGQSLRAGRDVDFRMIPPPARTCALWRASLDRAVCNLLENAFRYTPAGGTVTLTMTAEGETLTIAVEDTGPGFSPEALARGGQAFYTSDAARPREGHMGMGLYYAGQTARRHGGTLQLSNTGHGARAALRLPMA